MRILADAKHQSFVVAQQVIFIYGRYAGLLLVYEIVTGDILAGGGEGYPVRDAPSFPLHDMHVSVPASEARATRACSATRWAPTAAGAPTDRSFWAS